MFDILAYLYENCHHTDLAEDGDLIARKLSAAGFDDSDISEALSWLAGVLRAPQRFVEQLPDCARALRAFAPKEIAKLDPECRGFVMHLENVGVLDAELRELVIDRAMAASARALSVDQLKLIVLMVLWNHDVPAGRLIAEELLSDSEERLPN